MYGIAKYKTKGKVQVQLLAYHIAVVKGCDVDQPRNLAKFITME